MHENKIKETWGEEERKKDEQKPNKLGQVVPRELWEHMDMAVEVEHTIKPMKEPMITKDKIKKCLQHTKKKKKSGPDGLKPELYKTLTKDETCIEALAECLKKELDIRQKPPKWKKSKTKMKKTVKKPTAKELRPIALTNMPYKLFMSLVKNEIEEHLEENRGLKEIQAGFTMGGRIEDDILILQYLVEETYKMKKSLIVISVNFRKAYDSVKREKIIEVMKDYKIHPKVIDATTEIYEGDMGVRRGGAAREGISPPPPWNFWKIKKIAWKIQNE